MGETAAKPRILLADDNVLIRDLVQGTLEEAGYDVLALESGPRRWPLWTLTTPSSVWSPTSISGGTPVGWDVATRARERHPTIAVVYLTGESAHDWSAHAQTPRAMSPKKTGNRSGP
ncbi:MAG: hypothetical protein KKE02_16625 [Alphaproteobacteria bacterium]|nr:hypothetical protein [Alphaproteobacteria bacterium]MBU1516666.1 hypothetical protein [Alphaproteobacteria bacterium]MBU2094422.1 hypothetical protein [Alphaproteobacteria bacterium]MBU2152649.1 hypothetical protein [Alphaproteobacteria bacterium]MBU2306141.1 hypothetical protein [Alphaproteobacteria bacterium]